MKRITRGAAVVLVVAGAIGAAFAAPASADPLDGCPGGGGWQQLIWSPERSPLPPPYSWGPAAARADGQGNNDGYACKTVFTAAGNVIGQVIDNRVQAGS